MVKRLPASKPLAIGVIGTGETSTENIEAQLNDFTSTYEDVSFVLPVSDDYWSPAMSAIVAWVEANDLPYVAVTNGSVPSKRLAPLLEGAAETLKVARISTKMVQLLKAQRDEGEDAALLVLWDDEDAEAVQAVNKALNSEVPALNLLDGLDPFTFDEDPEGDDEERVTAELDTDEQPTFDTTPAAAEEPDDYDDWGVRKLRAALRERKDEHDIPDRTIGQLEKDDAIRALRNIDNGKGKVAEVAAAPVEDDDDTPAVLDTSIMPTSALEEEARQETRTTRARRAFAEGAGEGQEQARPLPKSKGSDILENEDDDDGIVGAEVVDKGFTNEVAETSGAFEDAALRLEALRTLGPIDPSQVAEAIAAANRLVGFLKGERRSPGRPRADGSPAQPREINPETGKVVRRRGTRSE